MPIRRPAHALSLLAAVAFTRCSASEPPAPQPFEYPTELLNQLAQHPPPDEDDAPRPAPALVATAPAAQPPPPDHEPELVRRDVPDTVVAGRRVSFGIDVIDDEMDVVRIALGDHPEGATLDPRTLTVDWTVPPHATGAQHFVVHIVEHPGETGEHAVDRAFYVNVVAHAPAAHRTPLPTAVGSFVTITSPEFVGRAARDWPIERLFERLRDDAIDALPADAQATVQRPNGAALFRDFLHAYALAHHFDPMDPAGAHYDRRFDSAHWRLVAVRPRANKAIEELRLVYQNVAVPEPVFAMFRVRLFRGATSPSAAVTAANNAAFLRLLHDAYFDGTRLKPGIATDEPAAVATAVANLVHAVLTYRDPQNPLLRTGLAALPEEARLGGGSRFDAQGEYVSGNGWAFTVANLVIDPPDCTAQRSVHVATVPLSSFTFDIGPNAAGDAWTSVCPERYRDGGAGSTPELVALCQPDGTVRIPEPADDHVVPARRDAMDAHREVTTGEMVAHVPLRDPRRRNFEENGMTCVQCHMRNFDDGVLSEVQVRDPRVQEPITPAHDVERVRLQVLPIGPVARSGWFVQQETFQVCDLGRKLREVFHVDATFECPEGY